MLTLENVMDEITTIKRELAEIKEVLGTEFARKKSILSKIKNIENLINNKEYAIAGERIATLESILGTKDNEILRLRTILDFEFEED